jgi:rhodanese-related sulfurtransferase
MSTTNTTVYTAHSAAATPSLVFQTQAASADAVIHWFSQRLQFETDCSDVHNALQHGATDFVLLDVRATDAYERGHVPGALNLPHRQINLMTLQALPPAQLLVVYCAGVHCNGADQAAVKIAQLGYQVKIMLGGIQGYQDEGFALTAAARNDAATLSCGC